MMWRSKLLILGGRILAVSTHFTTTRLSNLASLQTLVGDEKMSIRFGGMEAYGMGELDAGNEDTEWRNLVCRTRFWILILYIQRVISKSETYDG